MVTKGHHHMNHAKAFNYFLQALACAFGVAAIVTYGGITWGQTKILMAFAVVSAFSAFFHALFHYIKEDRMKR